MGSDLLAARRRIEGFARLLDESFEIPGLRIRFGWDSLIGLVPVLGDIATFILSMYIVAEALRAGVPPPVLSRMLVNVAADSVIGSVPVAGDLFDVAYRSNKKNARLLANWMDSPAEVHARSRWMLFGIGLAVLAAGAALIAAGILIAMWIARATGLSS